MTIKKVNLSLRPQTNFKPIAQQPFKTLVEEMHERDANIFRKINDVPLKSDFIEIKSVEKRDLIPIEYNSYYAHKHMNKNDIFEGNTWYANFLEQLYQKLTEDGNEENTHTNDSDNEWKMV